jgi:hypothetical protein
LKIFLYTRLEGVYEDITAFNLAMLAKQGGSFGPTLITLCPDC